ncbi:CUB and zona pellucida-like domain-containing protein 1 [Haliotis rufescens]|uniref:CUB and zona pellucida-like domain-containing protein 1 n=1 Tax=Haliotis rufescens TaxID=6454 RepID=UPI00201F7B39|nr:CUB and zona pellucida-like domain-containing protein 1 [Haliotis rufescens]
MASGNLIQRSLKMSYNQFVQSSVEQLRLFAESEGKFIRSPNYPFDYPRKAEYIWTLQGRRTVETIDVEVITTDMEKSEDCVNDRAEVYDGESKRDRLLGKWCGLETPSFRSSGQYLTIVLISNDNDISGGGFRIKYNLTQEESTTISNIRFYDHGRQPYLRQTQQKHLWYFTTIISIDVNVGATVRGATGGLLAIVMIGASIVII